MTHAPLLSRRALLGTALPGAAALALPATAAGPATTREAIAVLPNRPTRKGGLLVLPARGELFVASDFHGRHNDFRRWLQRTRLLDRIRAGDDVYGLITGDSVDYKAGDPESAPDGDTRIIEAIREAQAGRNGERLILLQGNHERQVVKLYEALVKERGMTPRNQRDVVRALFAGELGDYFAQFNFVERITPEQFAFLKGLPVLALGAQGVVCVHGGPSPAADDVHDIIDRKELVVDELQWSRPVMEGRAGGYSHDDVARFLRTLGARLLVTGHTPVVMLPREWWRDGVGVFGKQQVILSTSFGAIPGQKRLLALDLAKQYDGADALKAGREILPLDDPK